MLKEHEIVRESPFPADRISRLRRAVFAFGSTSFCLFMPVVFVLMGFENTLARTVTDGLLSFAELMAVLYLSAGVIDNAGLGRFIRNRFERHSQSQETFDATAPQYDSSYSPQNSEGGPQ